MVRASLDPLQPVIGLVGSHQKFALSASGLEQRLAAANPALRDRSPFFRSGAHAQLLMVGDLRAAEPPFTSSAITTDDHPLFAFLGPLSLGPKEQLIGVTFLNWAGRRFPQPSFPSCELGETSPEDLLSAIRAGNHYLAAAVAATALPNDPRPPAVREHQTQQALERAQELSPSRHLTLEDLGH